DLYFTQLGNDLFRFGSFRHLSAPFAKPRLTDSPDHFPGSRPPTGQVLVIQAASGAGKSSFLKAGLWPRLARDPDFVPLAMLRPATGILTGDTGVGRQFAAFFAARDLAGTRGPTAAAIHQELRKTGDAAILYFAGLINTAIEIAHAARRLAAPDAPLPTPLIAVDQTEELFGAGDLEESTRFLKMAAGLLDPNHAGGPKVSAAPLFVWTLRADSLDGLLQATAATGLKPPELFPLPPIPRDAYRDIIETPLEVANKAGMKLSIDPLLVDALVSKSKGADALPLLAFTLRQLLADNRAGASAFLTLESFERAGGMEGILAARLAAARRAVRGGPDALRRLFLPHLCTWDAEANPPGAKRLIAREADLIAGPRAFIVPLIEALVGERLLTRSSDDSGAVTLEVAHEALLRQPPISEWLEEDREFLIWRDNNAKARIGYEANVRGPLIGRELQIARDWLETRSNTEEVGQADRAFIEFSLAEDRRRINEEEERERRRQEEVLEKVAAAQVVTAKVQHRWKRILFIWPVLVLAAAEWAINMSVEGTDIEVWSPQEETQTVDSGASIDCDAENRRDLIPANCQRELVSASSSASFGIIRSAEELAERAWARQARAKFGDRYATLRRAACRQLLCFQASVAGTRRCQVSGFPCSIRLPIVTSYPSLDCGVAEPADARCKLERISATGEYTFFNAQAAAYKEWQKIVIGKYGERFINIERSACRRQECISRLPALIGRAWTSCTFTANPCPPA
ncbi:MAG: hypothetical protein WBX25_15240, partial [Rhodomicrobium sp.]